MTGSTQAEDGRCANVSPDAELEKAGSEPAGSGVCIGVGSSSDLRVTRVRYQHPVRSYLLIS